jgi:MFS family permease
MNKELLKLNTLHFFLSLFFIGPIAVYFYKERGLNLLEVMTLESILAAFIFLFEVPTGIFADRYGRKNSIVAGILIFFIETAMMRFARGFLAFAVIFALTGIAVTFMSGSVEALIYDALKKRRKTHLMKKAMGSYGSYSLAGKFIAPVIGAYIARDLLPVEYTYLIYMTLVAVTIAFFIALSLKDGENKAVATDKPAAMLLLSESIGLVRHNKLLLRVILLDIFACPFIFEFKYLAQESFNNAGIDVAVFGSVFGASVALAALAKKYAYKFEALLGARKVIFLATALPGVLYVSIVFVPNPAWLIASFILLRMVSETAGPLFSEYRNSHIPSANRATVISLVSMMGGVYLMATRVIIGKLAGAGLNYAFLFMGAVILAASLFFRVGEAHVRVPESAYAETRL